MSKSAPDSFRVSARSRKAIMAVLLTGALPAIAAGQDPGSDLIAYEGFEYDVGSSIEQLDGGTGWGGPWRWRADFTGSGTRQTDAAIVQEGSLAYEDLAVRGNHVLLSGELGELQLGRALEDAITGEPGTSTYISYIGQRVGPKDDPTGDGWDPNVYPRGASIRMWSDTSERLSIGNFSNRMQDEWAIYGSGLPLTHSGVSFSEELAFVVVRIDHKDPNAGVGDNIYAWINPDLSAPEDPASAEIQLVDIAESQGDGEGGETLAPVHVGDLTWVSPFAGNASSDGRGNLIRPHAELLVDELRIGRTLAAVTPKELRWAGFLQDDESFVDTGAFLQWLFLTPSSWNFSYSLESWIHLPSSRVSAEGAWVFFLDTNAQPPAPGAGAAVWEGFPVGEGATVDTGHFLQTVKVDRAPWIWSEALQTWLYVPEGYLAGGSGYAYVWNWNAQVVDLPGQAVLPSPVDGDEHVDTSDGFVTLVWNAGQGAASHDVYFGTDADAVANATPNSPEFLGNIDGNSIEIEDAFYSLNEYFWRVDAANSAGTATGNVWRFRPRQLAFPGAEGYGRFAVGGRHGRVVKVTNLNDSGPGSLRAAIEVETGPRIIVFDVSGLITLESHLTIADDDHHVTLAGQTAPGKGITIRKHKLGVSGTHDVVVRFVRLRLGSIADQTSDGTGMQGADHSIYDHVSVSWSLDEGFSSRSAENITLQRTIISEALNVSGHKNYPEGTGHGYAASIGGDVGSFHHNLLAHNAGRNWSMAGGLDTTGAYQGRLDLRNNVVYNWRHRTTDGGAARVNFVNNYYKAGEATTRHVFINPQQEGIGAGSQDYYVAGNILDDPANRVGPENQDDGLTNAGAEWYKDAPFFEPHVNTQSAEEAFKIVLSDVGSNMPMIDNHDHRMVSETLDGTFSASGSVTGYPGLVDNEQDSGGWEDYPEEHRSADWDSDDDGLPDWFEEIAGTDLDSDEGDFSDMRSDPDGDGYTLMDAYLHWMATPHVEVAAGQSVAINLSELARGFTASPVFTVTDSVGGSSIIMGDGFTAEFTASADFSGIGGFHFTVSDADGHTMTREIGVRVVAGS